VTSQNPDPAWQRPEDSVVRPASARLVDPEDDLAATYGGETETTRIPSTNRGMGGVPPTPPPLTPPPPTPSSAGRGLLHEPDPLPYVRPVQPPAGAGQPVAAPTEIIPGDPEELARTASRRGTQDLGLLLLRVALGALLIAHGLQNAFGFWGGSGPAGLKESLVAAGYQHAGLLSYVTAGVQIGSGVLLVLGLFTPVVAAVALGLLLNGALSELRADGWRLVLGSAGEQLLVLTAVAAAIVLVGPGRYGFDGTRGWARRPFIGSFVALVLGVGGGVAAWMFLRGHNPFA
jgi:putative oxidoreductase